MTGRAELVGGPLDQARAWRIYLAKFPFVRDFMSEPGEFLAAYASSMGKVRFYRLIPSRIWLTDNQMRFGKREVLDLQRCG